MKHGTLLGAIDLIATKHALNALRNMTLMSQIDEMLQHLVGDEVLAVVEQQLATGILDMILVESRRVNAEEIRDLDGIAGDTLMKLL
jgi:hypothetical protein